MLFSRIYDKAPDFRATHILYQDNLAVHNMKLIRDFVVLHRLPLFNTGVSVCKANPVEGLHSMLKHHYGKLCDVETQRLQRQSRMGMHLRWSQELTMKLIKNASDLITKEKRLRL